MVSGPFLKKKICLIEDDENIREIYCRSLQNGGYEVLTAENGQSGMELIRKERPDAILLDLQMPVMDGYQVLEKLAEEGLSSIPVVILSNADDEAASRRVGQYETRFYLVKALTTPQKALDILAEVLH